MRELAIVGQKESQVVGEIRQAEKSGFVGTGEGKRFTGAGLKNYDIAAEAEYELIRKVKMSEIGDLARNTGLSVDEIRTIKKHLFYGKHQIPQPRGKEFRLERFAAADEIAFAWKSAQKGELSAEQKTAPT